MASAEAAGVMDDLWRELPGEILLHKVLPFVPFPDLCRFRAVCTNWNKQISEPAFQATTRSKTSYILLMPAGAQLSPVPPRTSDLWVLHNAVKTHVFEQDYLEHLPSTRDKFLFCYSQCFRTAIAADRGFVCVNGVQYYKPRSGYYDVLCVVNPVTRSHQEVPCFPRTGSLFVAMSMIVAEDWLSFRLFALQGGNGVDHCCFVYDSLVGEWCPIADPRSPGPAPGLLHPCHTLRMGRKLVTVFLRYEELQTWDSSYEIHVYDMDEDAWAHAAVREPPGRARADDDAPFWTIPQAMGDYVWTIPQLVECGGRLYFTAWEQDETIVIWALDLETNSCVMVAESAVEYIAEGELAQPGEAPGSSSGASSSLALVAEEVTTPTVSLVNHFWQFYRIAANVVAFGTDDGRILFSTLTRSSAAFSLSDRSWAHTPFCRNGNFMEGENEMQSATNVGLLGCMTTLTLCPVPKIAQPAAIEEEL